MLPLGIFLLGTLVGGLIRLVIVKLTANLSNVCSFSYGDSRDRSLRYSDPAYSCGYLQHRGNHHHGRIRVLSRAPAVELAAGALFSTLYVAYGFSPEWAVLSAYSFFFLAIVIIDLKYQVVLNRLLYPAMPLILLLAVLYPQGLAAGGEPFERLLSSFIGGIVAFGVLLIPALVNENAMGWGDVKLAGLIGLITGFPGVLMALGMAITGAGVAAVVMLLAHFKGRKETFAFGPFLSGGAMAALLWGTTIASWWVALAR